MEEICGKKTLRVALLLIFTAQMTQEKFIMALGERVRKIRTDKKMSMYRLAKNTGKQPAAILRLEKGQITPSLYYLSEIAEGLGVELEKLIVGLP